MGRRISVDRHVREHPMGVCVKREWLREAPGASAEVKAPSGLQQRQAVRSEVPDQPQERDASRGENTRDR
ncbi:hypothetical protein Sp245p_19040 (plasmid) [Azospirillum baldaniorum]|uniref:Uncharacterized protein n=1 Tax=Azospirillum baldaniorum TaxID=1064539 RepID=A0A9P1JUZ0_9PROT|nr:hypothetical protein Sp245p_19040 [Azospirillum baldaniorum]CCD00311.1 protein of unknown function [Azospirillum baldaniorum]